MRIISKDEAEKFYSSLPEEISNIFREKIRLVYIEDQTLFWKSSVSDEDKQILSLYNASIKNQLRIIFNCGIIKPIPCSEDKICFFVEALKLLQVKEVKFPL